MPNYTEFLNLEKPLQSEQYNVDVFNLNCDKIDNFAKSQIVPIATTETAGIVKPDGTTITVQADGTISSTVGDNFADKDINNLNNLGNARLQYAPFAINAGTVINGNNHTLQSGSFIQSYTEAGSYTIEITEAGNYEIEMYGAGGGWAHTYWDPGYGGWNSKNASGGSGAGFKGVLNLPVGNYSIVIGAGGSGGSGGKDNTYVGGTGGSTSFGNIITVTGGTGGTTGRNYMQAGAGGTVSIIDSSLIVSTSLNQNGNAGNVLNVDYSYAIASLYGGVSLYDGTHTGYGAGGGSAQASINGYFKITKLTGDASKIFCNPCTITTTDGRTRIFDTASSFDVLSDAEYKKCNVTINGALTQDKGTLSGFANSVYASLPSAWISENYDTWEMVFDITTGSNVSTQQYIYSNYYNSSGVFSGVNIEINSSKFRLDLRIGGSHTEQRGTYTVLTNTRYLIRIKFTGSAYTLEYSTDNGLTWVIDINYASTTKVTTRSEGYFVIGGLWYQSHGGVQSPFLGSINLINSYIKNNGELWWQGIIDGTSSDYDFTSVDGDSKIFKDFETGELFFTNDFKISNLNPSTDYWLDTSTTPANLRVKGEINNNLVYIGDCTIENGGVTALNNRAFNDSGYLVDKSVMGMPDYSATIEITPTSTEQSFTCPCNGFVIFSAGAIGGIYSWLKINDVYINNVSTTSNNYITNVFACALVAKNDVCTFRDGYQSTIFGRFFKFFPVKGVN